MLAAILGGQLVAIRAGWAERDAAVMLARVDGGLRQGLRSVIGPSTANTPRSLSMTMR
jgi:hypothetical protein